MVSFTLVAVHLFVPHSSNTAHSHTLLQSHSSTFLSSVFSLSPSHTPAMAEVASKQHLNANAIVLSTNLANRFLFPLFPPSCLWKLTYTISLSCVSTSLLHLSIVIIRLIHTDNSHHRNIPAAFDHILMEGTIPQPNVFLFLVLWKGY